MIKHLPLAILAIFSIAECYTSPTTVSEDRNESFLATHTQALPKPDTMAIAYRRIYRPRPPNVPVRPPNGPVRPPKNIDPDRFGPYRYTPYDLPAPLTKPYGFGLSSDKPYLVQTAAPRPSRPGPDRGTTYHVPTSEPNRPDPPRPDDGGVDEETISPMPLPTGNIYDSGIIPDKFKSPGSAPTTSFNSPSSAPTTTSVSTTTGNSSGPSAQLDSLLMISALCITWYMLLI